MVSSYCSTSGTRHVSLIQNPVTSHEMGKVDSVVTMTSHEMGKVDSVVTVTSHEMGKVDSVVM
jgi:hypothetical protein